MRQTRRGVAVRRTVNAVRRWWAAFTDESGEPSPDQRCLTGRLGVGWRRDVWPGLVRYSLRRQRRNAGGRVYVHRFAVTDSDVHNHPWAWGFSIILRGQYTEEWCDGGPDGPFARRVIRWWNYIPVMRYHRVTELGTERAVWTLFVCGEPVDPAHQGGQ